MLGLGVPGVNPYLIVSIIITFAALVRIALKRKL
jgi:hypothetical protein